MYNFIQKAWEDVITFMKIRSKIVCFFLFALSAYGQGNLGSISGKVTDPDGAAVVNAQIAVKSSAAASFQTKSGADGTYSLTSLSPGTYTLTAVFPGLQPYQRQDVAVNAGQAVQMDVRLADFGSLGALGEDRTFYADVLGSHDAPAGPVPRMPDGKPDFSGIWHTLRVTDPGKPDMLAWAEALTRERIANNSKDFPNSRCLPYGVTLEAAFLPFRMMQNATLLAMLFAEDLPREIYLDGRGHPEEPLAPFVGHSIGKWDGDTLVVDTVGFNDKTWVDLTGHPHTNKLHLTERFRRKDLGHLEVEITIDDPGAYKKPWTMKRASELAPASEELGQYVCTENNQDTEHLVGK